jgi:hypothetical protein
MNIGTMQVLKRCGHASIVGVLTAMMLSLMPPENTLTISLQDSQ